MATIQELKDAGHSQEQAEAIAQKIDYDDCSSPVGFYGDKVSNNIVMTPEGFMICLNVVIATCAPMQYNNKDVGLDTDKQTVTLINPANELLSASTIASFKGKPVTVNHPASRLLNPENVSQYTVGNVTNVRADIQNERLIADLVILSSEAINTIKNGIREVSSGYDVISIKDNGDGTGTRYGIVGNHVAIVPRGRCGGECSINDHKEDLVVDKKSIKEKILAMFANDDDDNGDDMGDGEAAFDAKAAFNDLSQKFNDFTAQFAAKDAEPAQEDDKLTQILALLNKLLEAEAAEGTNDADDVIKTCKINPPLEIKAQVAPSNDEAEIMTPAKLNALYADHYNK